MRISISFRRNVLLSRLKALLSFQRFNHTLVEGGPQDELYADMVSDSVSEPGRTELSKWRKLDSRTLGITQSRISQPSWIVLKVLQNKGFDAYLVGGCVRDLLLNKVPKDFDVITTAALRQIRQQFHRSVIVGRRFPICRVHVKGSVIEVSSFETVAQHAKEKEKFLIPQMPRGCDKKDLVRWRNSMHRDFTINSLFFDPFVNKIYDYVNGMMDLRSLKLRTLVPAQFSFTEDCARILRGLRIAARLGLAISKEIEIAIRQLSSSIMSLDKSRIMMELNYMLSYGAAEPSMCLLRKFNLLEILLPFHAAYLEEQASKQSTLSSMMLMRLFFNLDQLVTCDRPSNCSLWIALLAFHMVLVNNPQSALVVLTFASVLYHGKWEEGVIFARQHAQEPISFVPEISEACDFISDDELVERVSKFAMQVQDSIGVLTDSDSLLEKMTRFQGFRCFGLVFVSKKMEKDAAELFNVLVHDVQSYEKRRKSLEINYNLLGKGNLWETRFVLGKIIMDTMICGIVQGVEVAEEKYHLHIFGCEQKVDVFEGNCQMTSDLKKHHVVHKEEKHSILSYKSEPVQDSVKKQKVVGKKSKLSGQEITKKQKAIVNKRSDERFEKKQDRTGNEKCQETGCMSQDHLTKKEDKTETTYVLAENIITMLSEEKGCQLQHKVVEHDNDQESAEEQRKSVEKCDPPQDRIMQQEEVVMNKKIRERNRKCKQETIKEKGSRSALSSLFK